MPYLLQCWALFLSRIPGLIPRFQWEVYHIHLSPWNNAAGARYNSVFQIYSPLPPKIIVFMACHRWNSCMKNLQRPLRFALILKKYRLDVVKTYIFVVLKSLAFQWYHFYCLNSIPSYSCIFSSSILRRLFLNFHFEFKFYN